MALTEEINKLADYLLANHPEAIKDGSAVDVAIYVMQKAAHPDENTSDGFHTFKELYEYRLLYNAALFNEWAKHRKNTVYKSVCHSDGEFPFGGGWFVVGAVLPNVGQITNHYKVEDWGLFHVPEVPRAAEWDGHTPADVAKRLEEYILND